MTSRDLFSSLGCWVGKDCDWEYCPPGVEYLLGPAIDVDDWAGDRGRKDSEGVIPGSSLGVDPSLSIRWNLSIPNWSIGEAGARSDCCCELQAVDGSVFCRMQFAHV